MVAVYRLGECAGHPYLVSQYIDGQSLDSLAKPMLWQEALRIGIELARGLAAAHKQRVLHRDIKPANIMLTQDGQVKLLDFALAKFLDTLPSDSLPQCISQRGMVLARPSLSVSRKRLGLALTSSFGKPGLIGKSDETRGEPAMSEQCLGTPLYMAPEVWRGDRASPATDIYSLGAVLYEMACGQPPHDADDLLSLREAVLNREPLSACLRSAFKSASWPGWLSPYMRAEALKHSLDPAASRRQS